MKKRTILAAVLVCLVALATAASVLAGGSSQAAPKSSKATFLATLVSDIGKFTDRSFNQSQLEGLKRAKKLYNIKIQPLQSNSTSDYVPNFNTAVRSHSNITIAAGFLLADTVETFADKFPTTKFAITDYCAKGATKRCITGSVLTRNHPNVMGLDYAANQSGCLVGYLAAEMAKRHGGKQVIGAVGGLHIPPVDIWIAGYKYCAMKAVPGTKVLVNYSQDFVASDKCKTQAQNLISQGAQVLFQVAGLCGLGTLKAADDAGIWGIGVDKDQYNDAKRVLTSGVKRVDVGVFDAIKAVQDGKFKGGSDLNFDLKNDGMSVGKINPAVPQKFIDEMNDYKKQIIRGRLKVPSAL